MANKKSTSSRPTSSANSTKHRKRKSNRSLFPILIAVTIILGILISVKAFTTVYNYVMSGDQSDSEADSLENQFAADKIIDQVQSNLIGSDIDGVIKAIDNPTQKITFYSLKANETVILTATDTTLYPGSKSFGDYKIGDVVTFVYDEERNLTHIKECENAWEYSDVGLIISDDAKLVKFGDKAREYKDKSFKYTEGITTVRYKNNYVDMSQVTELDYVTIRGYDNGRESKVYSITIEKGHGTLTINNYNKINDGMIQLNDAEPIPLSSTGTMDILEGKYTITITGSNCEPFKDDIVITPTTPFTLDLSNIQIKSGVLNVTANVNDYTVTIDGTDYPMGEPILLDYGKYEVKVNKEDYDTYTDTVTINQDINTFNAQLKETVKYGTANITANPGSAKIYIDGTLAGVSPQSKKVAVGSHTITIKLDGYIDESHTIYISGPDDVVNESFDLTPQVSAYVITE